MGSHLPPDTSEHTSPWPECGQHVFYINSEHTEVKKSPKRTYRENYNTATSHMHKMHCYLINTVPQFFLGILLGKESLPHSKLTSSELYTRAVVKFPNIYGHNSSNILCKPRPKSPHSLHTNNPLS